MRPIFAAFLTAILIMLSGYAQTPTSIAVQGTLSATTTQLAVSGIPSILPDIGPDHHRIYRVSQFTDASGQSHTVTNQYVQIETGLNRMNASGAWEETSDLIEITATNAVAAGLRHEVLFAPNINTAEAIQVRMPGGKWVTWNPIGISYYDSQSGNSVLLAEITNSIGVVVGRNQVIYTNCFNGLDADIRITVTRHGVEQDLILHSQPASPEAYGLNSETTQLEVMTEFVKAPVKATTVGGALALSPGASGNSMAQPVLQDQRVDFGAMALESGQAFDVGSGLAPSGPASVNPVYKHWTSTPDGTRVILYEALPVNGIIPWIQGLPHASTRSVKVGRRQQAAAGSKAFDESPLLPKPSPRVASTDNQSQFPQFARGDYDVRGVVVDFPLTLGTNSVSNFTFQGDTTYYLTGLY